MTQDKINILWATESPIDAVDGHLTSDRASIRYRVLMPAEQLAGQGYESAFVTIDDGTTYADFRAAGAGDVVAMRD